MWGLNFLTSPAIHSALSWAGFFLWVLAGLSLCIATSAIVWDATASKSATPKKPPKSIPYFPSTPRTNFEPADDPDFRFSDPMPDHWVRAAAGKSRG